MVSISKLPSGRQCPFASWPTNYWNSVQIPKTGKENTWSKPPAGWVKLNTDAAFDAQCYSRGSGAIIRDDHGDFIAASNRMIRHIYEAATTEALALCDGLDLATRTGCNKLIVLLDFLEVIKAMQEGGFSATAAAPIYDDCIFIAGGFDSIVFEYCPREGNMAAHELAEICNVSQPNVWLADPPSLLIPFLVNDVSVSKG